MPSWRIKSPFMILLGLCHCLVCARLGVQTGYTVEGIAGGTVPMKVVGSRGIRFTLLISLCVFADMIPRKWYDGRGDVVFGTIDRIRPYSVGVYFGSSVPSASVGTPISEWPVGEVNGAVSLTKDPVGGTVGVCPSEPVT